MPGLEKLIFNFVKSIAAIFFCFIFLFIILLMSGFAGDDADMFFMAFLFFIFFVAISLLALIVYAIVFVYSYSKAKEKLRSIWNFSSERFEREVKRAPQMKNVVLCSDAICFSGTGNLVKVIPIEEIVWAYQGEENNSSYLCLYLQDKTEVKLSVSIKKKVGTVDQASRYILRLIARKSPAVFIGYSEQTEALQKNNFNQLVARVKYTRPVDSYLLEQEYISKNYYVNDFH